MFLLKASNPIDWFQFSKKNIDIIEMKLALLEKGRILSFSRAIYQINKFLMFKTSKSIKNDYYFKEKLDRLQKNKYSLSYKFKTKQKSFYDSQLLNLQNKCFFIFKTITI